MKVRLLKRSISLCVLLVTMLALTGCCSVRCVERYLVSSPTPDYLVLKTGQAYTATKPERWASYRLMRDKDQQILDLLEALKIAQARAAMGPSN